MYSYTKKEIEDLKLYMNHNYKYLEYTQEWAKDKLANAEALINVMSFFNNYKDPIIIYNKILEFSNLSDSHKLIFNIIYSKTLEELIPYLNTEFEPIVVWRYSLGKKQT